VVRGLSSVILALFAVVVIHAAWLSDDAYITFRVVENAVNGLGLTWNPAERVQGYTHPLWLFALMAGRLVTGELYYSAIWLSVALSVAAVALIAFRLRPGIAAGLGVLILTLSRAFVDYATSGLENPLTHLLLAAFLVVYFAAEPSDRRIFFLSLLAALLAVNRLDALLLVAPALGWALWQRRTWRAFGLAALGFLPLLAWTAFSLVYYGFPFPNTAYAKLATGIAPAALARQGLAYLLNSLRWDPLTLAAVAAALLLALASRRAAALAVAAGIALYLIYIVRIGGDFMSGRFLAAPLLAAIALLVVLGDAYLRQRTTDHRPTTNDHGLQTTANRSYLVSRISYLVSWLAVILALGLLGRAQFWLAGRPTGDDARRDGDIADERAYYAPHTGLFTRDRAPHPWAEQGMELRAAGPAVVEHGNVGFLGYYAGPAVHIVDRNGLTDPLLARLPVRDPADWRIGHFRREVPPGYVDTLRSGQNVIQDAALAAFYEPLSIVARGPLWSEARLREIWRLNTGYYDHLLPAVWPRPTD
jgi:arabinofuranosyltransferase